MDEQSKRKADRGAMVRDLTSQIAALNIVVGQLRLQLLQYRLLVETLVKVLSETIDELNRARGSTDGH